MELYRIEEKEKTIPDYSFFADKDNEFELIEEQQDIDIQEIEELDIYEENVTKGNMIDIINELVEAVKQLDRKINTKYCENCGVELNKENTALPNMCCECKYGEEE